MKLPSVIPLPDPGAEIEARRRLDQLTKPPGSLGRLEELIVLGGELEAHAVEAGSSYLLLYTRSALLRTWTHLGDHARVDETAEWVEAADEGNL
jgi:hypothetical protein